MLVRTTRIETRNALFACRLNHYTPPLLADQGALLEMKEISEVFFVSTIDVNALISRRAIDGLTWKAAAVPASLHLQRVELLERVHLERLLLEDDLEGDDFPQEGVENLVILRSGLPEVQLDRGSNPLVEDQPHLSAETLLILKYESQKHRIRHERSDWMHDDAR